MSRAPELHALLQGTPSYETEVAHLLHRWHSEIEQLTEVIRLFRLPHKGRLRVPEHGDTHYKPDDALRAAQQSRFQKAKELILNYSVRVP